MKNKYSNIIYLLIALVVINFLGSKVYKRYDLTEDNRYTLSLATKNSIQKIEDIRSAALLHDLGKTDDCVQGCS